MNNLDFKSVHMWLFLKSFFFKTFAKVMRDWSLQILELKFRLLASWTCPHNKSRLQLFDGRVSAASTLRLWSLTPPPALHCRRCRRCRQPAKWPHACHWPAHCFYSRHHRRRCCWARWLPPATLRNVARICFRVGQSLCSVLLCHLKFCSVFFLNLICTDNLNIIYQSNFSYQVLFMNLKWNT